MVIAVVEGVVRRVAHANATYTKLTPMMAPAHIVSHGGLVSNAAGGLRCVSDCVLLIPYMTAAHASDEWMRYSLPSCKLLAVTRAVRNVATV